MAHTIARTEAPPLSAINTTPLIDVLLVLLVMLILTIPAATQITAFSLPRPSDSPLPVIRPVNRLEITAGSGIRWNGTGVDEGGLARLLRISAAQRDEPEVDFAPAAGAPYGTAARVLRLVKASGLLRIGFVGLEPYAAFDRPAPRRR